MAGEIKKLLTINAVMKQGVEQRFATILQEREQIKRKIEALQKSVEDQRRALQDNMEKDPMSPFHFSEWEAAQSRRIAALRLRDADLAEKLIPLRKELATIFVRETTLEKQLSAQIAIKRQNLQKTDAERVLSIWTQEKF